MPGWLAAIVHVPLPTSETLAPEIAHTLALAGATESVTVKPELATAETRFEDPPTVALAGGLEVKVIDCTLSDGTVTAKDC